MISTSYQQIRNSLQQLYLDDPRPWLVGFSGGKDSTLVAALVFEAVLSVPPEQRTKPVTVLCTDTRVEIPAIAEGVESTLDRMRRFSEATYDGTQRAVQGCAVAAVEVDRVGEAFPVWERLNGCLIILKPHRP